MSYVYVLELRNGKFYTGMTNNLRRRFQEHQNGNVDSTSSLLPVRLIFYEAFVLKSDAMRREKYLKTSKGKSTLRMMMKDLFTNS